MKRASARGSMPRLDLDQASRGAESSPVTSPNTGANDTKIELKNQIPFMAECAAQPYQSAKGAGSPLSAGES